MPLIERALVISRYLPGNNLIVIEGLGKLRGFGGTVQAIGVCIVIVIPDLCLLTPILLFDRGVVVIDFQLYVQSFDFFNVIVEGQRTVIVAFCSFCISSNI